jgi:hypothetical protein
MMTLGLSLRGLTLAAAISFTVHAQTPTVYTVSTVGSLFGPNMSSTVYRDGAKAVIDHVTKSPDGKTTHTRSYYDLQAKTTISWDADNAAPDCSNGTYGGSWGDPFEDGASMTADLNKPSTKNLGTETYIGIAAKVVEVSQDGGTFKAWIDPKTNLLLKLEASMPNGPKQTMIEVKQVSYAKPPAAIFAVPRSCVDAAARPPDDLARFAAETGGNPEDFANAIMPPTKPSADSCTVLLRIVAAGSMQTVNGYKVSIDNADKTAQLRNGVLRIDNAPQDFNLSIRFAGDVGGADAMIHRQCPLPQTVLLMVMKNPNKAGEGADWMWVKSGKYAK